MGSKGVALLPEFIRDHYEVLEWKHACAILKSDFPEEWEDILHVLTRFRLPKSHVQVGGGNKSKVARSLDGAFYTLGWKKKTFQTQTVIDGRKLDNPTHEIDCYKNEVALETEWNNKDPFFDRDLNNFRILFELRAVSVGVIITRGDELDKLFKELGKKTAGGANTTHWSQLVPRIQGGGGGGCPVLAFGITKELYVSSG